MVDRRQTSRTHFRQHVFPTCCILHFLNDGYVVAVFPILPLISRELHLSYTEAGMVRAALRASLALFQIPSVMIGELVGEFLLLTIGMMLLSAGLVLAAFSLSLTQLLISMVGAGVGGSVYHPVGTSIVSRGSDERRRGSRIGILNFSGDVGKAVIPFLVGLVASQFGWRFSFGLIGLSGVAISFVLIGAVRRVMNRRVRGQEGMLSFSLPKIGRDIFRYPRRFYLFCFVGILDAMIRTGVETFMPFLFVIKGFSEDSFGFYVSLIFIGGALGKFGCGSFSDRFGSTITIALTEALTGLAVLSILLIPRQAIIPFLILLGFFLSGTSTVLYSVVPDLVSFERTGQAYAVFYTMTIGFGTFAPIIVGVTADILTLVPAFMLLSLFAILVAPIAVFVLKSRQ